MWVKGHSRLLKLVPFESLGTVSYLQFIVTMAVYYTVHLAVCEISSDKEWQDIDSWAGLGSFKVTENSVV